MVRFNLQEKAQAHAAEIGVTTAWQACVQLCLCIYEEILANPEVLLENQWHNITLLQVARRRCRYVGLATMSHCEQVQRVLRILNLGGTFDFMASRDDVERGKPDPEIYLLVANEFGVNLAECLVIEDSLAGGKAALEAGMAVVAVSTPFTR